MACEAEECKDQSQYAVNGVTGCNNRDGTEQRNKTKTVEQVTCGGQGFKMGQKGVELIHFL